MQEQHSSFHLRQEFSQKKLSKNCSRCLGVGRKCVETQSHVGTHCFQREFKKQEKQLSLTMDLPLIGQVSKGLIQSPRSLEVAFKWTSQAVFILMADKPFLAWRGLFLHVHLFVQDLVFTTAKNHTPNTIKMSVWLLVFLKTVDPQRANAAISQSCILKSWICADLESSHAVGPCEVLVSDVEYARFLFLLQWLSLFFLCVS